MRRFLIYDHLGNQAAELSDKQVIDLTRREEINGEHSLEITTTQVLEQGQRILYQDGRGVWREYVVLGVDQEHESGNAAIGTYYCVWSLQVDMLGVPVSKMPGVQTPVPAGSALADALSGQTRWAVGTVTNTKTGGASMYDMNAWKALGVLVDNWGGEVSATIEVSTLSGVTARKVDLYAQMGETTAKRRYDFGADATSIKRTLPDEPLYCRLSPRGAGEETEGGGYGRKITIESVNGGKDYLTYSPMVELAKIPDGNGGYQYPTLIVENSDCKEPSELKAWAQSVLAKTLTPKVTYEIDVVQAAIEGVDVQGVSLGDVVHIVDLKLGLRIEARVVGMTVDELNERNSTVTIGDIGATLAKKLANLSKSISGAYDATIDLQNTLATAEYVDALLGRLNAEINATGGYTYITQGEGVRTYDTAVSDPLVGAEASQVVEIKGGTIRIANSRTAGGEWDWRTVLVSGRIAADLVTAAQLTSGYIGSVSSGNYWNLDTGTFNIGVGSTMGGATVQDVLDAIDLAITEVDVEYAQNQSQTTAPTTGWSTTAPAWQAGYYIWSRTKTVTANGTEYSAPVCISGRDGQTGTNAAAVYLYKRAATAPTKDMADPLTYTFTTGAITGSLGSWSRSIPSGTDTCWVVMATAISNSATDTIARSEWSDPVALSTAGVDGLNQATVFLFQRAKTWEFRVDSLVAPRASAMTVSGTTATIPGTVSGTTLTLTEAPAKPTVPTTYTFATGELSPIPAGWSRNAPDGDDTCWVTTAAAIASAAIDIIEAAEWADVARLTGEPESGAVYTVRYAVGTSGTTAPTSGWQSTVPATSQGQWLWVRTTFADGKTSDTCSYIGTDGEDGVSVYVQSATKSGGVTTVKLVDTDGNVTTMTINDGEDGETGAAGANGYVHLAWANSADGTVGFSTTESSGKKYIGAYTDNTEADSTNPTAYNWSRIAGENGLNQATITLYKRSASTPTAPTSTCTYTFSTHTLSGSLAGWTQTLPNGTDPVWAIAATASSSEDTDTIASGEWASPVKLLSDGADGLNQATIFLYRRAYDWRVSDGGLIAPNATVFTVSGETATINTATVSGTTLTIPSAVPTKPSTATTYTFETGRLSPIPSGWQRDIPAGKAPCWVTTAAAIGTGTTDTIDADDWADVVKLVEDGADGADGVGISGVTEQYARNNSSTTAPTSWGTAVLTPTASERYVWNREILQYTDGSSDNPTTPHVVAVFGENGNDGRGIASITNYYAISASASTVPADSEFSTSVKTPTDAKPHLWNYEVITYTTGNPTTTAKHVVGSRGVGISGVIEEFAANNNPSTAPTSGWTTDVITPTSAVKYVWNREKMQYTDGTTGAATAAHVVAVYGDTGSAGKGIASITNYYAVSATATAPSDSAFSTTVKVPTKENPYLWNYEIVTYTTGSPTTTAKHIIGKYGDKGIGVAAIEEQYYLSTSDTMQTGGSWSANQPAWRSGRYIWTRSKITWTEGDPEYTDPVLAKAINGANSTADTANTTAQQADSTANDAKTTAEGAASTAAAAANLASQANNSANRTSKALDTLNTQEGIFNKLTNNGQAQGIIKDSDGNLWINATYINTGILDADLIKTGMIVSENGRVYFDLDNNVLACTTLTAQSGWSGSAAQDPGELVAEISRITTSVPGIGGTPFSVFKLYNKKYETGQVLICPPKAKSTSYHEEVVGITTPNTGLALSAHTYYADARNGLAMLSLRKDRFEVITTKSETSGGSYISLTPPTGSTGTTGSTIGLAAQTISARGNLDVSGKLTVTGTKNRLVDTEHYADRLLYAYETPAPYFGDIGSASTDEDGYCYVAVDDIFAETVKLTMGYQVFLQKCGEGDIWVAEKHPGYFVVRGTPNLAFDWEIKAHQRDYEHTRTECHSFMEQVDEEQGYSPDYEGLYADEYGIIDAIERSQYGDNQAA